MKNPVSPSPTTTNPAVPREELRALAAFRQDLVRFLDSSKKAAESFGLTSQQYHALLFIEGFSKDGSMTLAELVERLMTAHNAVIELLDRMEAAGLVKRSVEEWDKRRVTIRLTAKASKKLHHLAQLQIAELQQRESIARSFRT